MEKCLRVLRSLDGIQINYFIIVRTYYGAGKKNKILWAAMIMHKVKRAIFWMLEMISLLALE